MERERELAALAMRQHGIVSRRQLVDAGLGARTIQRRVEAGRLRRLHRGVYAYGGGPSTRPGTWLAAVLAHGDDALLSHSSAAELWGLRRPKAGPVDVTSHEGHRGRAEIRLHQGGVHRAERKVKDRIPITSVARTLLDLAEEVDFRELERAWEEADRLGLLQLGEIELACERAYGRHALKPIRRLLADARAATFTRSPLEDRFAAFCRELGLPAPATNALVLGHEVDAYWPAHRLIIELDGFAYHAHRAAFERDRARDAALQAGGYHVVRLTHRRLEEEASTVAAELREFLDVPDLDVPEIKHP